jgi:hypothetical protein
MAGTSSHTTSSGTRRKRLGDLEVGTSPIAHRWSSRWCVTRRCGWRLLKHRVAPAHLSRVGTDYSRAGGCAVLTSATRLAVSAGRVISFRVAELRVSPVQADFWSGFDSRQLHRGLAGRDYPSWPIGRITSGFRPAGGGRNRTRDQKLPDSRTLQRRSLPNELVGQVDWHGKKSDANRTILADSGHSC